MITVKVLLGEVFSKGTWCKPWLPTRRLPGCPAFRHRIVLISSGLFACVSMKIRLPKTHSAAI